MVPQQQQSSFHALLDGLKDQFDQLLKAGEIPPEWDEFELTELLFEWARLQRWEWRSRPHSGSRRVRDFLEVLQLWKDEGLYEQTGKKPTGPNSAVQRHTVRPAGMVREGCEDLSRSLR